MCFGVSLSRWSSDRLEKQNFGEFAKKEGGGKLLEIGARKVRWNADELDTTLKTVKNHRLTQ